MAKSAREAEGSEELRLGSEIRKVLREGIQAREIAPATTTLMEGTGREKKPLLKRDILWRLRTIGLKQVTSFTRELSILLEAGISLLPCLRSLAKRTRNEKFREVIHLVGLMIENGDPFWRSLAKFPRYFSKLYVSTVRAGEVSGQLGSVLSRLAEFGEREYMLRRRVRGGLLYPVLVVVMAIIVSVVISVFMMPVFARLFEELGAELPFLTRALIAIGTFLSQSWYLLVLIAVFLVGAPGLLRKTVGGRLLLDRLKLKLPLVGGITLTRAASRFARTFATLLSSGVPMLESLSIARETVGNEVVAMHLESIRKGVERGESLESSLEKATVFPPLLADMIVVGEQSGTLDTVLVQIADIYDEEVNISLSNLTTVMEPLLILGMGVLVALIFFSFFAPYVNLIMALGHW